MASIKKLKSGTAPPTGDGGLSKINPTKKPFNFQNEATCGSTESGSY